MKRPSGIWRVVSGACVVFAIAAVIGLPIAVDRRTTLDVVHRATSKAPPRASAFVVSEPITLGEAMPFSIAGGTLHGADPNAVGTQHAIKRLIADEAQFTLDISSATPENPSAPTARLSPLLAQLADFNIETLVLRKARIQVKLEGGAAIQLTDVTAEVMARRKSGFTAKGLATFNGQRLQFDAIGGDPADMKTPQRMPLKVTLSSGYLETVLDGRIGFGTEISFAGKSEIKARKLRGLVRWLIAPLAHGLDVAIAGISGPLEISGKRIAFSDAVVTVDGHEGRGALTVSFGGPRPKIDGTLAFQKLDISQGLFDFIRGGAERENTTHDGHAFGLPLAKLADADLRLSTTKVGLPHVETGRGAVVIAINDGRIGADLAELEIEGGTLAGQFTFNTISEAPRIGFRGKLTNVDPGRVFAGVMQRNPLFGRADIALEGAAIGTTVDELLASVSGKGTFRLVEGGRLGLDLKALAYAADHGKGPVGWASAGKGSTPLDQLDARFQVMNGVVYFEQLQAKSNASTIVGHGTVDVSRQVLDFGLSMASDGTAPRSQELLKFLGSWADPAIIFLRSQMRAVNPELIPAAQGAR